MKKKQPFSKTYLSISLMGFLILSSNLVADDAQQAPPKMKGNEASVQINADGSKSIQDPDGTSIQIMPDGTKIIKKTDGTRVQIKPDGTKSVQNPDGSSIQIMSDGTKIIKKPDGSQVQVKPAQGNPGDD